jgi:hypothetical protein
MVSFQGLFFALIPKRICVKNQVSSIDFVWTIFSCKNTPFSRHPATNHRRPEQETEIERWQPRYLPSSTESITRISPYTYGNLEIQIPKKDYQAPDGVLKPNTTKTSYMIIKNNPVISTVPRYPRYSVPTTVPNWSLPRLSVPTVKVAPK